MFSGSVFVMHAYMCEQILIQNIIQCTFVVHRVTLTYSTYKVCMYTSTYIH